MTMTMIRIIFWLIIVGVSLALIANQYRKKEKPFPWVRTLVAIALLVLVISMGSCGYKTVTPTKTNPPPASALATKTRASPGVVYAKTPATITADYEFNIESDGPVMVQYPHQKPELYVPGKGFKQLPEPRYSGPKIFTDPSDPTNGHVAFRLYPVHNGR